jgi:hypothetical protein
LTDIPSLFQSEYEKDVQKYFVEKLQEALPENISLALHQLEEKYNKKQVEKSDLDFLFLAQ